MNTVTLSAVTYPKSPKGFKGMGRYYEKTHVGTFTTPADTLEDIESEIRARRAEFPSANWFSVADESHPSGWVAGTV